ncbi:tetratricopeptide repeat protein [Intrasporangium calvum]|uniref:Tetratricopeptide repeat protein n=1 Tax=Intrasporangium calvum TaxID=53358 RepID=A0ABT5GCV5_9MICO|nr:tetratricopeptide repeat protein [Intrasporangium calvum]MDC5695715.1 tetratricopeptide repeat protein [Intrasporangium calvum]
MLSLFLRIGVVVLVAGLASVGFLYYKDQYVTPAPSMLQQQINLTEAEVRKNPNSVDARLHLGLVYQQAQRFDDAVAQFEQVLKVAPDSKDALVAKGYALLEKGDLEGAITPLTKVIKATRKGEFANSDSLLGAAYYYLGVIAIKQQKPEVAIDQLSHSLNIAPTDSDAMYQIGLAQLQQGKPEKAIATFKNALRFVPTGWCEPYQQMQGAYTTMKKPELAAYAGAMVAFCGDEVEEAKTQLTALTEGPAAAEAMLGLGLIAETESDSKAAIGWYEKALKEDPKNVSAMSSLSSLGVTPDAKPTAKK